MRTATKSFKAKLIGELRQAVGAYMMERPSVGVSTAMEWAVTSRIAIYLTRSARVRRWEKDEGVRVDAEYAQQGSEGQRKGRPGRWMKPDLIIHRRGKPAADDNWLVVEFKMHDGEYDPGAFESDRKKLQRYQELFEYRLALWVSIPRSPGAGTKAVYVEVNRLGEAGPVETLVQL